MNVYELHYILNGKCYSKLYSTIDGAFMFIRKNNISTYILFDLITCEVII